MKLTWNDFGEERSIQHQFLVARRCAHCVEKIGQDVDIGLSLETSWMSARVKAAMNDLGYRPHAAARGMRGRTYTVGIVHPDIRNTFFPDIISAIAEVVLPTERQMYFATSEWTSTQEILASMHDRQIEGVVVMAPSISEAKLIEAARQMPLVLTHKHSFSGACDTIVSDDDIGAMLVVQHFAEMGHQQTVHLGPATGRVATQVSYVSARRARAFTRAMEQLGLGRYVEIIHCPYTVGDGYRTAKELFSRSKLPTAIFAGTDNVAFGVMQAAFEAGIEFPKHLSLVGYDNTQTAALGAISLTSVDQNPHEIGTYAARLLLSRIEGRREAQRASFAPKLIARGTSGPPPNR